MSTTNDTIFLLTDDKKLQKVPNVEYETEDLLQALIAEYPELIVGEQINAEAPPKWLMVAREAGIPDSADGGSRWSVDHLLLDQYGRPTFIEAKRSSNNQIRREVVGQILDYAANAIVYWPGDRIRALATDQFGGTEALDAHIASFSEVGGDVDDPEVMVENYWDTVETNLRQGNVRLLFAADSIPRELRRIIEFLNEKMSTVEVLGVEIRQYQGRGISALVPRIVGQTETARDSKSRSPAGTTELLTKDEFLDSQNGNVRAFWSRLVEQAEQSTEWSTSWGKALAIRMLSPASDKSRSVIFSNTRREDPCISISLEYLRADYPDEIETLRDELMALGLDLGGKYRLWTWLNDETLSLAEKAIEKTQLFFEQMKRVDQDDSHAKVAQV
ncbi:MAG: hypothetical protein OEV34_03335 [Gammaproteobacteria bacterium]|jgi:hypothetical protein|nr:hypothetical protein [Gammaproteobacteria bacterium]